MSKFDQLDRSTQINLRRLYDDDPKNVPAKVINELLKTQTVYRKLGGTAIQPLVVASIVAINDTKQGETAEEQAESKTDTKGSK